TEPGIEALFSEKLAWVKSKAPEYAGLISGLKEADILNVSDAGFFGLQRTFSKPFAEGMNFKFAVKYDCSGTWRFTDFSNVAFTDSGTPTPPKVPPAAGPGVQPIDIPITIGVPAGGGTGTPTTPGTPATPGTPTTPGTPATPGTPTTPPAETKPVPLSSCNPCQSVVGCLACIDKQMAEQTLK
ncbi:MAG: hypothetical protein NT067_00590, partial [Candidatus Diapherotrites archaeon]|nr:hypothetical protein [Candidatus Diapherotrites archaeon]